MKHRSEIDGLRAIAVIPVIFYHAGVNAFSGGFVGVDVFFVISGYLITGIIVEEHTQGNFSITRFYERRARRILPALYAVMFVCIPFAFLWMLPSEFKLFSASLLSVNLFVSNILFWKEVGYFAAPAEQMPLLHTWSLSVEEQFYLFFPAFMILIWRAKINPLPIVAVVALLSLSLSEWGWRTHASANFYLAPTRCWELMVGSIAALWERNHQVRSSFVLSSAGLLAILAAVFFYDTSVPFPSVYALLPVLGTVCVLLFARDNTPARFILSLKPVVLIGLISYSAYLWHHPLFAFARIRSPFPLTTLDLAALGLLAIGLAYLSWLFIEQPARRQALADKSTVHFFCAVAGTTGVIIAVGVLGFAGNGLPSRKMPSGESFAGLRIDEKFAANTGVAKDCDQLSPGTKKCSVGLDPKILLWGDSYAMHLAQALEASPTKIGFVQHTMPSCTPILGIAPLHNTLEWQRRCIRSNDNALQFLKQTEGIEWVVMSSPYELLDWGFSTRNGKEKTTDPFKGVLDAVMNTIEQIRGAGAIPIIVSPPPNDGPHLADCVKKRMVFGGNPSSCSFDEHQYSQATKNAYRLMQALKDEVSVVRLDHLICPTGTCLPYRDEIPYYRSGGHLTRIGSREIGRKYDLAGKISNETQQVPK